MNISSNSSVHSSESRSRPHGRRSFQLSVVLSSRLPWHSLTALAHSPRSLPTSPCACFIPSANAPSAAYQRFISQELLPSASSPLCEYNPTTAASWAATTSPPGFSARSRSRKTLADLIGEACRQFSVTTDSLFSPSRQRHLAHVRAWIAHQALILRIASLSEVARTFHRYEASLRECVGPHVNYP